MTLYRIVGDNGDLHALPNGNLLVAGRRHLIEVAPGGSVTREGLSGVPLDGDIENVVVAPNGSLWGTVSDRQHEAPNDLLEEFRHTAAARPEIVHVIRGQVVNRTPVARKGASIDGLALAPNGDMWYGVDYFRLIGRVTRDGVVHEQQLAEPYRPDHVIAASDGTIYASLMGGRTPRGFGVVARIAGTNAKPRIFHFPSDDMVFGLIEGYDRAIWLRLEDLGSFDEKKPSNSITFVGRLDREGRLTKYREPLDMFRDAPPYSIDVGIGEPFARSEGRLWFVRGRRLGSITSTGHFESMPLPAEGFALDIAATDDGSLWVLQEVYDRNRCPSKCLNLTRIQPAARR